MAKNKTNTAVVDESVVVKTATKKRKKISLIMVEKPKK